MKTVKNLHIESYVKYMQKDPGTYSTSYITTNLSAIRFYYERVSGGKIHIKTNRQLGVIPRSQSERIGENRSMKPSDYARLIEKADSLCRDDYKKILALAKTLGLRLHESYSLRKTQISRAMNLDALVVKGKGGLIRVIPLTVEARSLLDEIYRGSSTNDDRIFVKPGTSTHREMKKFQRFIREARQQGIKTTYHSIRHAYAQNLYRNLRASGLTDFESRKIVSTRLGHGRIEITKIYLHN